MKAQINISTQQQLFTATFLPCVCGAQEEGEIVKDTVGTASGWEEKVQLLSAAQQCDLYFWSKTAWHTEFHFSFKKCLALEAESMLHMLPWGPFLLLCTIL